MTAKHPTLQVCGWTMPTPKMVPQNSIAWEPELQKWRTIIASFEDCSIVMIIHSHNDEIMTDAYGCVLNILLLSFGQP